MYTIPKKIAIPRPVKNLSGGEADKYFIREENFDILIEHEPFRTVTAVPEDMKEFMAGYLLSLGLIDGYDDILSCRICDMNKTYILLKKEISAAIKSAGGVHLYAANLSGRGWGDIVPLKSSKTYSAGQIREMYAMAGGDPFINAVSPLAYYSAYVGSGSMDKICVDTNESNVIDKMTGYIFENKLSEGVVITNARPRIEILRKLYLADICIGLFHGASTNPSYFFAGKAAFTLVSKDTADREYYIYADSAGRIK